MKWLVGVLGRQKAEHSLKRNDRFENEAGHVRVTRDPAKEHDGFIELEGEVTADSAIIAIAQTCKLVVENIDVLRDVQIEVEPK